MTAVFLAVLRMSAVGAVLIAGLAALHPITKQLFGASWHYRMCVVVLLFLLVPVSFLGGHLGLRTPNTDAPEVFYFVENLGEMITTSPNVSPVQMQNPDLEVDLAQTAALDNVISPVAYPPWIWLIGATAFLLVHSVQLIRFERRMAKTCLPVHNARLQAVFADCQREAGIQGELRLLSSNQVGTPILVGLLRSNLILPEVEIDEWEARMIFTHELIHWKRRDLWVKAAVLLANAIHWFNPAVYRLAKQTSTFCELSCDERVVADLDPAGRRFYGETILNMLSRAAGQSAGIYAPLAENKKDMERRLSNMMRYRRAPGKRALLSTALTLALFSATLLCSLALGAPSASAIISEAEQAANTLYELGLLKGVGTNADGSIDLALDRTPSRAEATVLLVRLLGREAQASAASHATPFTDLPSWAQDCVGYAYTAGLVQGISDTTFGADEPITAAQYLTCLLRALGYESGSDFRWDAAWALSDALGISSGEYGEDKPFTRGDIALLSVNALDTRLKSGTQTLGQAITAGGNAGRAFLTRQEMQIDGETVSLAATVEVVSLTEARVTLLFPFARYPNHLHSVGFVNIADPTRFFWLSYGDYSPETSLTGTIAPIWIDDAGVTRGQFAFYDLVNFVKEDGRVGWTVLLLEGSTFHFDQLGAEYELSCRLQYGLADSQGRSLPR